MDQHNLKALLDAGLCATVNSDDPAYFGGYINDNFVAAFDGLPALDASDAYRLAANSFEAAFVPAAQKAVWKQRLDQTFAAAG
jgi:adenosine deaminase